MSAQSYFNKKFTFKSADNHLPSVDVFFSKGDDQKHTGLQIIKSILNHVKSKLNNFQIEEWSRHTRNRNPAQQILPFLKNDIQGEFVTQAFSKFFECLSTYRMVHDVENVFRSIHLCEAPGAFIASLNHYLKLHHPNTEFRWRASTLNPYFEGNSISSMILDDRLIAHTLENWIFGESYDGDILSVGNIRSLIDYCKSFGVVHLVSGDGSIDCVEQPENQEEFVSKLHLAEFIVSLAVLCENGSMLIKMFTFYETTSIGILYVLSCCFNELNIFKPVTSKGGNSEVYVIGIGFKKAVLSDQIIEKMIGNFKDDTKCLLPLDAIPEDFIQQIVECARLFMNLQVGVIEENIRTFKKYDKNENERIQIIKHQLVEEYVKLYKIAPILENQRILGGLQITNDAVNLNIRVHSGSHNERMSVFCMSRCDQFQVYYDRLKQFYDSIIEISNSSFDALKFNNSDEHPKSFIRFIWGQQIRKVASSKFIIVTLMKYFIELRSFLEPNSEVYSDEEKRIITNGNQFIIDAEYFRRASSYEVYEKDVVMQLLNFILKLDSDTVIITNLPLFTQFVVGVTFYLLLFVFEEIRFNQVTIEFTSIKPNGKENLKILIEDLSQENKTTKTVLGICNTRKLFSLRSFYKAVINYNSHICLNFCSFYLNLCNDF